MSDGCDGLDLPGCLGETTGECGDDAIARRIERGQIARQRRMRARIHDMAGGWVDFGLINPLRAFRRGP